MRTSCERCAASTADDRLAYVCGYGCTFCRDCTTQMGGRCPNCNGELTSRGGRRAK